MKLLQGFCHGPTGGLYTGIPPASPLLFQQLLGESQNTVMNNDVFISNATKIQLEITLLKNTWFADVSSINLPVGKALVMVKNKHGYGRSLNTEDRAIGHKVLVNLSQVYLSKGIDTNYWRPTCYFIVRWHLPLSHVPFTVWIILYECINSSANFMTTVSR